MNPAVRRPALLAMLGTCSVLPAAPPTASAQLVAYDGFGSYPAGAQLESGSNGSPGTPVDGGFGWGGPYDVNNAIKSLVRAENRTANPVIYTNGAVFLHGGDRALRLYDIANGAYVVQRPLGQAFAAGEGQTLWFSFLFRTNNASPLANRDYFQLGFDDNSGAENGTPRVGIGATTVESTFPPSQPFRFFAKSTTANANTAFASPDIATTTTYFLVGRVASSTGTTFDTVDLFVDPASPESPAPPSATIGVDSGLATLTHVFLRTSGLDNGDAYVLDELRIGHTYATVVETPPFALDFDPDSAAPVGALRWCASLAATLQSSESLDPASWIPVPGPFPLDGTDFLLPAPATPRAFFRLWRP